MSLKGNYIGPMRYIKLHNQTVARANPDILRATMTLGGITYDLEENRFTVIPKPNGLVYIYHQYFYHTENGQRDMGRWYNTKMPIELLKNLPANNTFEHTLQHYENESGSENLGPVHIRVEFSPKAAARLRVAEVVA